MTEPQPSSLYGKLRLQAPGTNQLELASPGSVTWNGGVPELRIDSMEWSNWPGTNFIIAKNSTYDNIISFTGRGLLDITATIYLKLNIISHTSTQIKFSVDTISEPLPETLADTTLFGSTPSNYYVLIFKAKYEQYEMEFIRGSYMMVWPDN